MSLRSSISIINLEFFTITKSSSHPVNVIGQQYIHNIMTLLQDLLKEAIMVTLSQKVNANISFCFNVYINALLAANLHSVTQSSMCACSIVIIIFRLLGLLTSFHNFIILVIHLTIYLYFISFSRAHTLLWWALNLWVNNPSNTGTHKPESHHWNEWWRWCWVVFKCACYVFFYRPPSPL